MTDYGIGKLSAGEQQQLLHALAEWIRGGEMPEMDRAVQDAFDGITRGRECTVGAAVKGVADEYTFERAWQLYDKKVGRAKCEKKWNRLTLGERKAATEYIPRYVAATPDKQYRKNFETFINNKSWNDEIIAHNGDTQRQRLSAVAERIGRIRQCDGSFKG